MSNDGDNPWFVSNLDEFLQYCCPECDDKYPSKEPFVLHAFEKHAKAKDCLELRLDTEKVEVICKKQNYPTIPLKFQEIQIEDVVITTDVNNILEASHNQSFTSDSQSNIDPQIIMEQSVIPGQTVFVGSQNRFRCRFCPTIFDSEARKNDHMEFAHSKFMPKISFFKNQKQQEKYLEGLKKCDSTLKCEFCGLTFSSSEESKKIQHIAIVHEGVAKPSGEIKSNSCDICEKSFQNLLNLQIHVRQAHKDHPELKCNLCNLMFEKIVRKTEHMRVVHEGVKNYPCKECGQVFGWMSNLKDHINEAHPIDPIALAKQRQTSYVPQKCSVCQPGRKKYDTIFYATKGERFSYD